MELDGELDRVSAFEYAASFKAMLAKVEFGKIWKEVFNLCNYSYRAYKRKEELLSFYTKCLFTNNKLDFSAKKDIIRALCAFKELESDLLGTSFCDSKVVVNGTLRIGDRWDTKSGVASGWKLCRFENGTYKGLYDYEKDEKM